MTFNICLDEYHTLLSLALAASSGPRDGPDRGKKMSCKTISKSAGRAAKSKLKVLCLHGYAQTSDIFRQKMGVSEWDRCVTKSNWTSVFFLFNGTGVWLCIPRLIVSASHDRVCAELPRLWLNITSFRLTFCMLASIQLVCQHINIMTIFCLYQRRLQASA